ncbi:triple tyrosine motif-containing protein [Saccharicrinis aurantiacus]|uniref:triple tyrosine motif-containing protein n=1 Tax=Saccharicrinis aurantiacus TaxID=1849719 RepID=UPI00248F5750|nr:triple tyrosine motif-containing protein [Saccharicrinis aurantiacus]
MIQPYIKDSIFILITCLLFIQNTNAASVNEDSKSVVVTPSLRTFTKQDYKAENQNWSVSSSESGLVYFANSLGLLKYDGENWSLYKTDNVLRSVYCSGDTIYVGGSGLMGYFLERENLSQFHSLSNIQSDIWKIYKYNNEIVFQSFNRFFYLDKKGRIGIERLTEGNTSYSYLIDDEIYYQINYGPLYAIKPYGNSNRLVQDTLLKDYMVNYISKLNADKYLIGTLDNGLFILDNSKLTPLNGKLNSMLKKYKINRILKLNADTYVFGTLNGGVIVADITGKIKYIVNQSNGLPNNRIHSLHRQNDQNLWIGTENGISLVNLENPFRYLENRSAGLGINYDVIEYNGYFYLCTNQGVYRSKVDHTFPYEFKLELVDGTQGQVWSMYHIDDKLFLGHNTSTLLIDGEKLKQLSHIAGGYQFVQSKLNTNIIYQSSYYGVAVYKKENNNWNLFYTITNIDGPTRDVIENEDGSLIVTTQYKEAYHVYPNHEAQSAQIKDISKHATFSNSNWIRAFKIGNKNLLVTNDTSFYYEDEYLQIAPKELQGINYVSESIDDYSFILKDTELRLFNSKENNYVDIQYDLGRIESNLIFKYENIRKIADRSYVICLTDGLVYANIDSLLQHPVRNNKPIITNIYFSNDRRGEQYDVDSTQLVPYDFNTINITFSGLNYQTKSKYEFYLEGYHTEWRTIKNRNWVKFQNLREGEYTFNVKEVGNTQVSTYKFVVQPPFYRSTIAYTLYLITLVLILWLTQVFTKSIARKKLLKQRLKQRKIRNEQLLLNTKEELNTTVKELQYEVTNKTDKLTNLLLQNTKKKEVIDNIKDVLQGIKKEQRYVNARHIDNLTRMIKTNIDETKDWLVFEAAFSEAHQNFFKRLKEKHPKLTPEDLKLCAYLKVNLSSKELAPIFKITIRSVDLKIYRLKKKMDLQKDVKLKEYIQNFN